MLKVGIINITGYAGIELLRILENHPEVVISEVTGRSQAGKPLKEVFTHYSGDLMIKENLSESVDLIFSALPHKISASVLGQYVNNGISSIDFSADFRLPRNIYETTYDVKHPYPTLIDKFVYGLPEKDKSAIKNKKFIANPGCFPTSVILALLPLTDIKSESVIIDAKTGISGAGRSKKIDHSFSEISDNMVAYSVNGHRHEPEIEHHLNKNVHLTTHLAPMIRGIYSTIYFQTNEKVDEKIFDEYYSDHPFVSIKSLPPKVKDVRGSNFCHIFIQKLPKKSDTNTYRIISVIDNLVKGAAGQAVHNMNLMFNLEETLGLNNIALYP